MLLASCGAGEGLGQGYGNPASLARQDAPAALTPQASDTEASSRVDASEEASADGPVSTSVAEVGPGPEVSASPETATSEQPQAPAVVATASAPSVAVTTAPSAVSAGESTPSVQAPAPAVQSSNVFASPLEAPIWQDEFDTSGLPDSRRWGYDTYGNRGWWSNRELQYYAAARVRNSRVQDGKLIIEAHREWLDAAEFPDYGGQGFTSARIVSRKLADWTYGRVEVRAKLPCGRGTWPAIWMLPDEGKWPDDGEIDILEHVGFDPGLVHSTIHTQIYNHLYRTEKTAYTRVQGVCDDFHRYQLRWTPTRITTSVDDQPFFSFDNDGTGNRASWPFNKPMYLIINLAVGGSWGDQQGVDVSNFPQRLEVDYVRVYKD